MIHQFFSPNSGNILFKDRLEHPNSPDMIDSLSFKILFPFFSNERFLLLMTYNA